MVRSGRVPVRGRADALRALAGRAGGCVCSGGRRALERGEQLAPQPVDRRADGGTGQQCGPDDEADAGWVSELGTRSDTDTPQVGKYEILAHEMYASPKISQRLLEMTLDELDAAREWMLLLGRKTAREKIASLLAIIARRDVSLNPRSAGPIVFDLPLTREEMADYLGLTLETVSRQPLDNMGHLPR